MQHICHVTFSPTVCAYAFIMSTLTRKYCTYLAIQQYVWNRLEQPIANINIHYSYVTRMCGAIHI